MRVVALGCGDSVGTLDGGTGTWGVGTACVGSEDEGCGDTLGTLMVVARGRGDTMGGDPGVVTLGQGVWGHCGWGQRTWGVGTPGIGIWECEQWGVGTLMVVTLACGDIVGTWPLWGHFGDTVGGGTGMWGVGTL